MNSEEKRRDSLLDNQSCLVNALSRCFTQILISLCLWGNSLAGKLNNVFSDDCSAKSVRFNNNKKKTNEKAYIPVVVDYQYYRDHHHDDPDHHDHDDHHDHHDDHDDPDPPVNNGRSAGRPDSLSQYLDKRTLCLPLTAEVDTI